MGSERSITQTGGREASTGFIPGDYSLAVGMPSTRPPKGWRWTKLTDLARLESGHTPSRKFPEHWDGDVCWIGIRDATANHGQTIYDTNQHTTELGINNSSARMLPKNTVCLCRTASVGYVIVMGKEMATSQDFVNWVCLKDLYYHFLKYILLSENRSFLRFASGTTHQTIYFPEVKAFHVCHPPLPEQKAIAHILGSLDDKIELNRRLNATLEQMAQALFKSWFVDFDPVIDNILAKNMAKCPSPSLSQVERDRAGSSPSGRSGDEGSIFDGIPDELAERAQVRSQALANGTANREAAKNFPAAFQLTEEMGWIPEGWEVKDFGSIAQNIRTPADPTILPEDTPYVGLEHIDRQVFSLTKWGCASDVDSQKARFESSDFLFGKLRPYFHKVCQVQAEGICSTDILVIRPKENIFSGFVGCQIFEPDFVEYANLRSTGTRMPRASWKDMAKYEIALPGPQLIEAFNNIIQPKRTKCKRTVGETLTLAKLRDTLLPKLISGELHISEGVIN